MPNSIFDPNYNPFTVDQGSVDPRLDRSLAIKRKKEKEEAERIEKEKQLEKRVPGGFDNA